MLKTVNKLNLSEIEDEVLKFWQKNKVFEQSLKQRQDKKQFIFYEGPPTANARPGLHHVLARVFKDIICRYKTMRGYFVPRRAGWDTHGLPVEIEIEKKLGFKSKQDIEKYGIAKFNELAKKSVWEYKKDWEKLTERIGFWLDMEHPYITYENDYIEKLWEIFKKIDERGLLYQGHKIVPWCPRCGTALSSHELAQGYEKVSDQSVYVRFKVKNRDPEWKNASILSWTTTPWTLPGNVALAVNPQHKFVCAADPDKKGHWLVLEKTSAQRLGFVIEDEFSAKELIGVEYEPLFNVSKLKTKNSYKVYPADFVTNEEGAGVVHTAVMYGEDDYELGKKFGLPQHHTVDEQGRFTKDVPGLAGLYVKAKATEEKIIKHLETKNYKLKTENYVHDYPFCWRCETPVLYYARNSWFIAMSKLRKELLTANKKINWIPKHLKEGRFGEWLKEVKDWAISRERYWGTPLPIWLCGKCGEKMVIGSIKELEKYGGKAPDDLHRPYIDEVVLGCPDCGGEMRRVKEVIDVWFDSGAMPFASGEYPERYPADYICEAIDQTRGWFYTVLAIGVLMKASAPYKNVISLGHLLDKRGQKMSKSKDNAVDPWEVINKYGVDTVRWYFYTVNPPGEPKKFDEADLLKTKRRFHDLLYNSFVFFTTYSGQNFQFSISNFQLRNILDRWIIARLNEVILETTEKLDDYDIGGAAKTIEGLVDDLSHWYIRRSRKRPEALPVLGYVLLEISKLIAPFAPFFAETLYRVLSIKYQVSRNKNSFNTQYLIPNAKTSVHLESWPEADKKLIDKKLLDQMAEARRLASLALAARAAAGIKIRQPLAAFRIKNQELRIRGSRELLEILAEEVNVKEIIFDPKIKEEMELDAKITPELEEEGILRELTRMIQDFRKEKGLQPKDKIKLRAELPEKILKVAQANDKQLRHEINAAKIEYQESAKANLVLL